MAKKASKKSSKKSSKKAVASKKSSKKAAPKKSSKKKKKKSKMSWFRRKKKMTPKETDRVLLTMLTGFLNMDRDNSGELSLDEMERSIREQAKNARKAAEKKLKQVKKDLKKQKKVDEDERTDEDEQLIKMLEATKNQIESVLGTETDQAKDQAKAMLELMDEDGNGQVSFKEFVKFEKRNTPAQTPLLKAATPLYKKFHKGKDGFIKYKDFKADLAELRNGRELEKADAIKQLKKWGVKGPKPFPKKFNMIHALILYANFLRLKSQKQEKKESPTLEKKGKKGKKASSKDHVHGPDTEAFKVTMEQMVKAVNSRAPERDESDSEDESDASGSEDESEASGSEDESEASGSEDESEASGSEDESEASGSEDESSG